MRIVPPHFPAPRLLVYVSGAAEMMGAIGLLRPLTRYYAAWGLVLLLLAVFPANVYMAIAHIQVTSPAIPQWLLWTRLPLQAVLIGWILWAAKANRANHPFETRKSYRKTVLYKERRESLK